MRIKPIKPDKKNAKHITPVVHSSVQSSEYSYIHYLTSNTLKNAYNVVLTLLLVNHTCSSLMEVNNSITLTTHRLLLGVDIPHTIIV